MPPGYYLESLRVGGFNAEQEGLSNLQIPDSGRLSFPLVLPDHVLPGLQDIKVTDLRTGAMCLHRKFGHRMKKQGTKVQRRRKQGMKPSLHSFVKNTIRRWNSITPLLVDVVL